LARRDEQRQTISVRHRLAPSTLALLDPLRREQSNQTRLAYVRAAKPDGTVVENGRTVAAWATVDEKTVRHAVQVLRPAGVGDSRTIGHAVRRGLAARKATPDGSAVFGSVGEARRRTKGLTTHDEAKRARLMPLYLCGDRVCRGNALAKLVMVDAAGVEVAARGAPLDPLPKKRERPLKETTKRPRPSADRPEAWLRHAPPAGAVLHDDMPKDARVTALRLALRAGPVTVPLVNQRGKQGRLLARVAWAGSAGLVNVTIQVDDEHVHVTFDPVALAGHPERKAPTAFVRHRTMGVDRNPNAIGAAVIDAAVRDRVVRPDLPGTVVDHLLIAPNLDRYASKEEAQEAMAKAADAMVGLARRNRCGTIVVEGLRNLGCGRTRSRRLNHLLSRWCREKFLGGLRRRAALSGIEVLEVWAAYSTTIGNVLHDLPDACASGAEMARRGLAMRAATAAGETKRLLPAYDAGHVLGRLKGLPPAPPKAPARWKEGTRAASRTGHEARLARLVVRAEHVAGWKELHRALSKSGVRARRPHPTRSSGVAVAARLGPSPRGRRFMPRGVDRGGTRDLG
jgi:IS605 OrfB family transposase